MPVEARPGKPLRIALLTPAWPHGSRPNGIVTYSREMVAALRIAGASVHVIAGQIDDGEEDGFVTKPPARKVSLWHRLSARIDPQGERERWGQSIADEVNRLHVSEGIELVEMEESFGWCGDVAQRCAIPVVARLHGPWFLNGPMVADPTAAAFRARVACEDAGLRAVAGVSAPSRDVLERTQARNGSQFSLSVVVPNPIRTVPFAERWAPAVADQAAVLFVGRFDRHKGGDIAIDAFARLRASGVMATLVFAGPDSGFLDDSGRRWHLRDYIADRLPDRRDREAIEILASQTPQALRELRRRAAVVVVPSRWEAFGYTLAEAMAQGCPIVASARGAFPEFLEHEKNGLLVGSESGDLWSEAIRRLLVDRELARELGENAAAAATAHLEPSAVANAALAFYSRAIASHSGGMK